MIDPVREAVATLERAALEASPTEAPTLLGDRAPPRDAVDAPLPLQGGAGEH
jgi:hypothetical protein